MSRSTKNVFFLYPFCLLSSDSKTFVSWLQCYVHFMLCFWYVQVMFILYWWKMLKNLMDTRAWSIAIIPNAVQYTSFHVVAHHWPGIPKQEYVCSSLLCLPASIPPSSHSHALPTLIPGKSRWKEEGKNGGESERRHRMADQARSRSQNLLI